MNLIIIRHADAGDPRQWNADDSERPLSDLGQRQAFALGEAIRQRGIELNLVLSSPLVRTRQTAESVLAGFGIAKEIQFSELLAPGELRRKKLAKQIAELGAESIAIVGHDPDLPAFLGWSLGVDPEHVYLVKGAAALVQFEEEPGKADGTLGWLITPYWYMNDSNSLHG